MIVMRSIPIEIPSKSLQSTLEELWKRYEPRRLLPFYR